MSLDERSTWRRHLAAVQAETAEAFLRAMDADGLELGRLERQLDTDDREVLNKVSAYHQRWRDEGGPHAEIQADPPRDYDPFADLGLRPREPEPPSRQWVAELHGWNHPQIKRLRGQWLAVLDRVLDEVLDQQPSGISPVEQAGVVIPAPSGTERAPLPGRDAQLEFTPVERAIVLLMRDGRHPRSARDYAKSVGVSHSTLGRNADWKRAYAVAQEIALAGAPQLPQGSKEPDGTLEAWTEQVCENCRKSSVATTVVVRGQAVRLCKECAVDHGSRTSANTD